MPVTISQLRASATVNLMTAAAALGLGRTAGTQPHPSSGPAVVGLPFAASRSRNGPTRSPS